MAAGAAEGCVLEQLFEVIQERRDADPKESHTAKLMAKGPQQIAKKLGEEAVEVVIEAVAGDKKRLVSESADLLYHLLVLWAAAGVEPEAVWDELTRRRRLSGIAEKAARPQD